jgi:hypothetical protein
MEFLIERGIIAIIQIEKKKVKQLRRVARKTLDERERRLRHKKGGGMVVVFSI